MFFRLTLYMQRLRMVAYAVLVMAFAVLATLPVTMIWKDKAWHFVHATDPRAIALFWEQGTANVIATLTVVLAFCAADLGVTAMGDDAAQRSLEWVVSRPQPRLSLAWSGWAASVVNAMLLVACGLLTMMAVMGTSTSTLDLAHLFEAAMSLAVPSLAMLSLAFALSVGSGNVRNGYLLALFTVIFAGIARYAYFSIVLRRYVPLYLISSNNYLYQPQMTLTFGAITLAVAAALSAGGAVVFARRDL